MIEIQVTVYSASLGFWQRLVWLAVAMLAAGLALWGIRRARDFVWKWGRFERNDDLVKNNNLAKRCIAAPAQWFYENWGIVIIVGAILLFVFVVLVITWLFGDRNFASAMAAGVAITVFLLFQLPRLLSPHVQIIPLETADTKLTGLTRPKDIKNQETLVDGQKKHITVRKMPPLNVGEATERCLFVTNTGINNYENWSIHLTFDSAIELDREWLKKIYETTKNIQYAEQSSQTISYSPRSGYSLGPNQDLIVKFKVTAKCTGQVNPLRLEINGSNRWGDTVKYFSWDIKESKICQTNPPKS